MLIWGKYIKLEWNGMERPKLFKQMNFGTSIALSLNSNGKQDSFFLCLSLLCEGEREEGRKEEVLVSERIGTWYIGCFIFSVAAPCKSSLDFSLDMSDMDLCQRYSHSGFKQYSHQLNGIISSITWTSVLINTTVFLLFGLFLSMIVFWIFVLL